jgi:hypothetical protein
VTTSHEVSLFVDVHDAKALHANAMQIATSNETGMSVEQAEEMLGQQSEPDISACLRMVFDPGLSPPGTKILDSACT